MNRLLCALIIALSMTACIPNAPLRTSGETSCESESRCGNSYYENHENYEIGFVEFTERGNDFNPENTKTIVEKLNNYKVIGKKTAVIVYIHGWKHNASPEDGNVISFKKALASLAKTKLINKKRVIGIYVGWRGKTIHGLGSENLTYWDRKTVAEEVGKGGVTDLLIRLEQIDRGTTNYYLIVGHSFGGAIALIAMHDLLNERLVSAQSNVGIESFGDGVILLNPAIEATQGLLLKENSHKIGLSQSLRHIRTDTPPLLYVISSDGDTANRIPFKIGQQIGTNLTWNQNVIKRKFNNDYYFFDEAEMDTTTIGNFQPFHTSILTDIKPTKGDTKTVSQSEAENQEKFAVSANENLGHWTYSSLCNPNGRNSTLSKTTIPCYSNEPLDFVYTSKSFISNHNDIFNENLTAFIATTVSKSIYHRKKDEYKINGRSSHYPECVNNNFEFTFGPCFIRHLNDILSATQEKKDK